MGHKQFGTNRGEKEREGMRMVQYVAGLLQYGFTVFHSFVDRCHVHSSELPTQAKYWKKQVF